MIFCERNVWLKGERDRDASRCWVDYLFTSLHLKCESRLVFFNDSKWLNSKQFLSRWDIFFTPVCHVMKKASNCRTNRFNFSTNSMFLLVFFVCFWWLHQLVAHTALTHSDSLLTSHFHLPYWCVTLPVCPLKTPVQAPVPVTQTLNSFIKRSSNLLLWNVSNLEWCGVWNW